MGAVVPISLRTYALALSLSLGPATARFLISLLKGKPRSHRFFSVLQRELRPTSFAFAVTLAVGGGSALKTLLDKILNVPTITKTFIANVLSASCGILLLQSGKLSRPDLPPPTLDLTLLLFVRALDVFVQYSVFKRTVEPPTPLHRPSKFVLSAVNQKLEQEKQKDIQTRRNSLRTSIDAVIFWVCSSRIMWCFFYEPHRLPASYSKWISALAEVDDRLLSTLRLLRAGAWQYGSSSNAYLLKDMASDLGLPTAWGDPNLVPAVGSSPSINQSWEALGVLNRHNVAGIPCEIVHGGVGSAIGMAGSCLSNSSLRGLKAFLKAFLIYLPAHFIPILLTRPKSLMRADRFLSTLLSVIRSSAFLSTFVASYWSAVCFARTWGLAKLFPSISHNFWDGPYGCILAGCLVCGSSIWIENGRRRGEMALYVLPKAIRASLPNRWLRSANFGVILAERVTFVLSLASLLTAQLHSPDTLRGLSRWTLAFVINGPNSGFWRMKREKTAASTPVYDTLRD